MLFKLRKKNIIVYLVLIHLLLITSCQSNNTNYLRPEHKVNSNEIEQQRNGRDDDNKKSKEQILKHKYPEQKIYKTITEDLDFDAENDFIAITEEGYLYHVNKKNEVIIVSDKFQIDPLEESTPILKVLQPSEKTKLIYFDYFYFPSNTESRFYELKNDQLTEVYSVINDWNIEIINEGKIIYQTHKSYRDEGGYDLFKIMYEWDDNTKDYIQQGDGQRIILD